MTMKRLGLLVSLFALVSCGRGNASSSLVVDHYLVTPEKAYTMTLKEIQPRLASLLNNLKTATSFGINGEAELALSASWVDTIVTQGQAEQGDSHKASASLEGVRLGFGSIVESDDYSKGKASLSLSGRLSGSYEMTPVSSEDSSVEVETLNQNLVGKAYLQGLDAYVDLSGAEIGINKFYPVAVALGQGLRVDIPALDDTMFEKTKVNIPGYGATLVHTIQTFLGEFLARSTLTAIPGEEGNASSADSSIMGLESKIDSSLDSPASGGEVSSTSNESEASSSTRTFETAIYEYLSAYTTVESFKDGSYGVSLALTQDELKEIDEKVTAEFPNVHMVNLFDKATYRYSVVFTESAIVSAGATVEATLPEYEAFPTEEDLAKAKDGTYVDHVKASFAIGVKLNFLQGAAVKVEDPTDPSSYREVINKYPEGM